MKTHKLKTWPELFQYSLTGLKTFEIRLNDRDFKVGDILNLQEYEPDHEKVLHGDNGYTGRSISRRVVFIMADSPWLPEGYVAMQLAPL